jgi:hypothetical protein
VSTQAAIDTIDDLEALKYRAKAHLEDVASRLDPDKVRQQFGRFLMRNGNVTLTTLLYGGHDEERAVMYAVIAEKDKHRLVAFYDRKKDACAFGVLMHDDTGSGKKVCLYNLTPDGIIEWLGPDMDQFLRYHDALLNATNDLTYDAVI